MCVVCVGVVTAATALSGLISPPVTEPVSIAATTSIVERFQPQSISLEPSPKALNIAGKRCVKRGTERVSKSVTFVCRKQGKKLIWVKKPEQPALPVSAPEPVYEPPTVSSGPVQTCRITDVSFERRQFNNQASGFPTLEQYVPHQSTVRMALIPIDWSDVPGDPSLIQSITSQTQKLTEWYDNVSEGRLKVEWVVHPNWIRLPGSANSYAVPYSGDKAATENFFNRVVPVVDSAFDFTGVQVANFLLPQGQTVIRESVQNWPWDASNTNEGRLTSATAAGAFFEQAPREYWSYWAHEFGHVLQLAHVGSSRRWSSMHGYDLMGSQDGPTRELSGWMRFLAGWLSDDQVYCQERSTLQPTTIMLNPLNERTSGVKAAIVRVSPTEAIIIESRRPNKWSCSTVGNSSYSTSGVLVYTYDATKGSQEEFLEAVRPEGRPSVNTGCPAPPEPNSLLQTGESVSIKGVTVSVVLGGPDRRYDTVSITPS